ncbi:helix-turn-helix transcriptional regulator [Actinomycetes bacterium KLBMP 9759]
MTANLTPLAVSVLALLCERSMHPYEMYRLMISRHEDEIVKVRPGSLYHTVDRLAGAEQVEAVGSDRDGGRPERTTYRITSDGRATLREWIRDVLATPMNEYPRFPVALGEAHNLPRAEVVELLRMRISSIERELARIDALMAANRPSEREPYLIAAHYGIEMRNAELRWLRDVADRLENKEMAWPLEEGA